VENIYTARASELLKADKIELANKELRAASKLPDVKNCSKE
jgi:hypothetical protein